MSVYGATMVMSLHVQYRLADIYAASFEDPRGGSRPRATEKWYEAFESTLGGAHALTREWLPEPLRSDVQGAVLIRNYLAHYFIYEMRALQSTSEGRHQLIERLMEVHGVFSDLSDRLLELHRSIMVKAGVPEDVYDAHVVEWGELSDGPDPVPIPSKRERIVTIHEAALGNGAVRLLFENDRGVFWLLSDIGLAAASVTAAERTTWQPFAALEPYLPADVVSRPKRSSNPPAWRSAFNYDIAFSTGATLRLEHPSGTDSVTFEVIPPAQPAATQMRPR